MGKARRDRRRTDAPGRSGSIDRLEPRLLLAGELIISEFMAANASTLADADGEYSDWIEIHNEGPAAASLANWYLTDKPGNLAKWRFPDVTLQPDGYLVVFASGKNRATPGQELHTNFSLDADGEYLALVEPDGSTIAWQMAFGHQERDISCGIDPDAPGRPMRFFATASPGRRNARAEVVINEIHYDPYIKTELVEFIELYNPGCADVDLSGASFTSGIRWTLPAGTVLQAGKYLVIAPHPAQFQAKFGYAAIGPPEGEDIGALDNEGDHIILRNAAGGVLDEVEYKAGFPWPTVGDYHDYSIQLINPDLDNNLGGNWRSAAPTVSPATMPNVTLISDHSTWDYRKGTSEASTPTSAWRQLDFVEDETWVRNAPAPIGYDTNTPGLIATTLSDMRRTSTSPPNGYISVFMRKTFYVEDPSQISALRLDAFFDDGINVWINGVHVLRENLVSSEMTYDQASGTSAREDNTYKQCPLPDPSGYLLSGLNVIAVQFHNVSISGSSDAFFDGRLIATPRVNAAAGQRNAGVWATNAPPAIRQVRHSPEAPRSGQSVTITAKVTDPEGVTSVNLLYQVVDPGAYIARTDAAYSTSWTAVPMRDDGAGGDAVAGDSIYTAVLGGELQVHRRLMRYRITATDGLGAGVFVPYSDDYQPNFAYFTYDGVPAWTGAVRPGVTQPVTYGTDVMNSLPTYHLITKQSDAEAATWTSKYGGEDYLWYGTLVYDGMVYDHIRYRARGGVWRYAMGKNMWKFNFNRNHPFYARDDYGNLYPVPWDTLNLGACIQQGDYWHRGEQGLFESVGFRLFQLAGVESPRTHFVQFRIIDNTSENGATQYDGDLWGLYLAVEEYDNNFLDAHGMPDGNMYKMDPGDPDPHEGGGSLVNQGPTQPTNNSDLVSFTSTYKNNTSPPDEQWWRDNLELEQYYSYRAIVEAIHHYDIDESAGKNYFYYHNPVTGKWSVHPWDLDLTWANNMYGGGNEPFKYRVLRSVYGAGSFNPSFPLQPNFAIEFQNRVRELRDLLYNPEQTGWLIDEMAAKIWTAGQPSFVDVDRSMWDYNPVMIDSTRVNLSKAGQGRFYAGNPPSIVIPSPGGFPGMMQKMKDYIVSRGTWMDTNLLTDTLYPYTPSVTYIGRAGFPLDDLRFRSSAFAGRTGVFAAMQWRIAEITDPSSPAFDPRAPRLYEITPTWQSGEITVFNSDITIPPSAVEPGRTYRVRVRMKDSTGRWSNWSAPVQFVAAVGSQVVRQSLRITELCYNPSEPSAGPWARDDYEFVELKNIGQQSINLAGVRFTKGISYTFGDIALSPGQHVVLAANPEAFALRYSTAGLTLAGPYSGKLDNGGERITLEDALGQTILDFTYDDDGEGWYSATDGRGYTLVVVDPASGADLNLPAAWMTGWQFDGTPGADEQTGWLVGGGGDDTYFVRQMGSTVQIFAESAPEGMPAWTLDAGVFNALHVAGGAGDDSLTIAGNLSVALTFDGAGGDDVIEIRAGVLDFAAGSLSGQPVLQLAGGATVNLLSSFCLSGLTIEDGCILAIAPDGRRVLRTGSLTLGTGATLDLNDNVLVVECGQSGKTSMRDAVASLVASGRNGGLWNGPGIVSTIAAGDPPGVSAVGVLLNEDASGTPLLAELFGEILTAADLIAGYTLSGDVNFDRRIDADDYFRIDQGWLNRGRTWRDGDLNYDGAVDGDDFYLIDTAFLWQTILFGGQTMPAGAQGQGAAAMWSDDISLWDRSVCLR